ncbi:MAG: hypothetical protein WDW38_001604 [Sanguina aurantia]
MVSSGTWGTTLACACATGVAECASSVATAQRHWPSPAPVATAAVGRGSCRRPQRSRVCKAAAVQNSGHPQRKGVCRIPMHMGVAGPRQIMQQRCINGCVTAAPRSPHPAAPSPPPGRA